jgi:predicted nucleotidyltransferase component of viral defense system
VSNDPSAASAASAASISARLANVGRATGREFQLILSDWAIERFLYRLGQSEHRSDFVLKGAMLLRIWTGDKGRATWDLDLLGRRRGSVAELEEVARQICAVVANDGIFFDPSSVRGEIIRAAQEEAGVRIRFEAHLARARIPMQVDVGFGDAVTPAESSITYPTVLGQPAPTVRAYPREAVIAEKVEAMVTLGVKNSRMKDFYDVRALAWTHAFEGEPLVEAIRATFGRRGTGLPRGVPVALTREFAEEPGRGGQWRAFLRRGRLAGPEGVGELSEDLRTFLMPPLEAAAIGASFTSRWTVGGSWEASGSEARS